MDDGSASAISHNFNNPEYVDISRRFLAEDLITNRLLICWECWAHQVYIFSRRTTRFFLRQCPEHTAGSQGVRCPAIRAVQLVVLGQFHTGFKARIDLKHNLADLCPIVLFAFLALVIFWLVRLINGGLSLAHSDCGMTIWFMFYTFIYVIVLTNFIKIGENAQLCYLVEPFFWMLFALCLFRTLCRRVLWCKGSRTVVCPLYH